MKTIQVRLPDRIHQRLRKLAEEEGISLNSLIVSSISSEAKRQETRISSVKRRRITIPRHLRRHCLSLPTTL